MMGGGGGGFFWHESSATSGGTRAMVERMNRRLPDPSHAAFAGIAPLAVYRKWPRVDAEDLAIMALIDRHYLVRP